MAARMKAKKEDRGGGGGYSVKIYLPRCHNKYTSFILVAPMNLKPIIVCYGLPNWVLGTEAGGVSALLSEKTRK